MMTSKDLYTSIADYACRHRLEDLIAKLFKDSENYQFSVSDISAVNLKSALVWMTVRNDSPDEFEDAVLAVNSLLHEAVACHCLDLFIRLSLGLQLKDLSHSLSLAPDVFEQKLERYFPGSKFPLNESHLSLVFAVKECKKFENMVADLCKYFRALVQNEAEISHLVKNHAQSMFGSKLSESLQNLTAAFFDSVSHTQPLNKLEQRVKCGVWKFVNESSSPWNDWVVSRLSGISVLKDNDVRDLLTELIGHESAEAAGHVNVVDGYRKSKVERTGRLAEIVNDSKTHMSYRESGVCNSTRIWSELMAENDGDDERSADEEDDFSIILSSCDKENSWMPTNLTSKTDRCTPNLRQFFKQTCVRGCVVKLHRI